MNPKRAFFKERFGKGGLRSICKVCMKKATTKYRNKNASKMKPALKKGVLRRRKRNRDFVREYLVSHPCVDCGESRWRVLEFDHIRGAKYADIAWMIVQTRSLENIAKEIAKCEVRCANCHRLRTAKQFGWYSA
jgi:thymidine kinase